MNCLKFIQVSALSLLVFFVPALQASPRLIPSMAHFDIHDCVNSAHAITQNLETLESSKFNNQLSKQNLNEAKNSLWLDKVAIHEAMRESFRQGSFTKNCADKLRDVFKSIRNLEDNLQIYDAKLNGKNNFYDNAFAHNNKQLNLHPEFENFNLIRDLKSGDIILSRGNAYTSAAIANLGEFDTQFSHMSVVYIDPKGKVFTVEAHIEVGAFVRTLSEHIADKNARTMLFRFDDENLAAKAAHFIFHKVKNASDTTGNILYDFAFNQEESKNLFCSEVASHAFDEVSNGVVQLPLFRSRLQARKPKFMKQLGITVKSSFVPSDIEVDPRFKLIAEWSDANKMSDSLQKDIVLQSMFSWSDKYGYKLQQSSSSDSLIYRNIAWPLRRVPYLQRYFDDKLPLNMSRQLVGYFGVLEGVGKHLQDIIKKADAESIEKNGLPLTKKEKADLLEVERLKAKKNPFNPLRRMYHP